MKLLTSKLGTFIALIFFMLSGAPEKAHAAQKLKRRYLVKDLRTGQNIQSKNPKELFAPMGGQKVVYAAAAYDLLGPAFRFGTLYNVRGQLSNGILRGQLVVEGHGDPTIDENRLSRVAARLSEAGIRKITGGILLSDLYYLPPLPVTAGVPLLTEEAPKRFFGPWKPTGALGLNTRMLKVTAYHLGKPTPEIALEPNGVNVPVTSFVSNGDFQRRLRGVVYSAAGASPIVIVNGAVSSQQEYSFPIEDSTFLAGQVLYGELGRAGIQVPYRIQIQTVSDKHKWVITDVSPELGSLLTMYMHNEELDENVFTEALIKRIGHDAVDQLGTGTVDYGVMVIRNYLQSTVGVKVDSAKFSPELAEGRFSAAQLVKVLTYMNKRFEVSAEFERSIGPARTHRQLIARGLSPRALKNMKAIVEVAHKRATAVGYAQSKDGVPMAFAASWEGGNPTQLVAAQNKFLEDLVNHKVGK